MKSYAKFRHLHGFIGRWVGWEGVGWNYVQFFARSQLNPVKRTPTHWPVDKLREFFYTDLFDRVWIGDVDQWTTSDPSAERQSTVMTRKL